MLKNLENIINLLNFIILNKLLNFLTNLGNYFFRLIYNKITKILYKMILNVNSYIILINYVKYNLIEVYKFNFLKTFI
jgi:hypothetical protein